MQRVGTTMTQAITLPILGIGAASAKVSSDMQDDLAKAAAQADLTGEQVSFIGDAAEETAIRTGESTSDIIEAYKFTISAGKSLAESQKIVGAAAEASAAGFGKQRDLVRTATTAMNAYGEEIGSGREFMDALVGSAQNMELEVSKLSRAFQKNVGIAKQLDIGMGELMASIGSVSEIMGDANRGGRLFSTMMAKLLKPTGEGADAIADVFGSVSNLRESIADRGLLATMVELRKELEATSEEGLGLVFSQRSLEAALNLTNAEGERTKQIMSDVGDTTGATNSAFQKSATFSRKLSQSFEALKSALRPIGDTIINALKPAIESSIELFKNMGDSLRAMSDEVKRQGLIVAGVLGASGPIIAAVGALTAALGAISWPVVLGVGAFTTAATIIAKNWKSIVQFFTSGEGAEMWDIVKDAAQSLRDTLKSTFRSIKRSIMVIWTVSGDEIVGAAETSFTNTIAIIENSLNTISFLLDTFTARWINDWDGFWTDNEERAKDFAQNIRGIMSNLWENISIASGPIFAQVQALKGLVGLFSDAKDEASDMPMIFKRTESTMGQMFDTFNSASVPFKNNIQQMIADVAEFRRFLSMDFQIGTMKAPDVDMSFEPMKRSADRAKESVKELGKNIGSMPDMKIQGMQAAEGSIANLQMKMRAFQNMRQFVDPNSQAFKQLTNSIKLTKKQINQLTGQAAESNKAMIGIFQTLDTVFQQAVIHGKKLGNILGNIAKQLASKALINGLAMLVSGSSFGIGKLLFGSVGSFFHEGGIVGGSGDQPIMAKGGEGVFTRDQMKAMGGMMRGNNRPSIDYGKIEQAFGRAFDKRIQRLGPDEVFAMNAKGARGF